ncbi:hypothetical protein [Leifsonia sp. C5G2]|uniref:hypothetical protein n=1 Tax=Leifsonia sp. C5G2 TaxID=2735269 RepID=UPI0015850ED1|nr:hypothetical protein [Leifsonia sp. C5G2]NUU07074.1 hypothetical protein [Leifsonia sp. C5G2]
MTHRPFTLITAVSLAGLAVFLGVLHSLFSAGTPARALTGDGHGPGYQSSDGWWLGSYHFDDGAIGFCLHPAKKAPTGLEYSYADAASTGWWTPEQAAVFAYIARTWAGSGDRTTAAAGQLATWMHAGLHPADARSKAARAGNDGDAVFARAMEMLDEARSRASTGVRAAVVVELAETGPGRVRVELTVDRLSGPEVLPPAAHLVQTTLTGATFADGSTTASLASGTDADIAPTGSEPSVSVSATATTGELPYGNAVTVALPATDAQAVLIAQPSSASASASADAKGPSPLPFQPQVETRTSAPEARPGAEVTDTLIVSVTDGEGLLPTWGVHETENGFEPVTAVVQSTLHGPFADPIAVAPEAPAGAPAVCTVETVVNGAGRYTTPACTLPADGYYVWTEQIDPERTDPAAGGARLKPWRSSFGIASEVTRATTAMSPAVTPTELAATGAADSVVPALFGTGAGVAGATMLTAARLRGRRGEGPRGARHVRRKTRPGRTHSLAVGRLVGGRLVGGRLVGPRHPRSTWFRA